MSGTTAARLTHLGTGKLEAPKLKPNLIIIRKGFNYRDTTSKAARAHIDWLKQSIKQSGIDKPIGVEFDAGKVYLVDGECRLIAAQELEKEGHEVLVPCIAVRGDEATVLAKAMTGNGALPPSNVEFGKAAQRLRDYGWTDEQIMTVCPPHIVLKGAKRAKRYINDTTDLSNAPLAVKEAVKNGIGGVKVTEAAALAAVRKHGKSGAYKALEAKATKAKGKGKKTIARDKAEGGVLFIGDQLADLVLAETWDTAVMMDMARAWKKARK